MHESFFKRLHLLLIFELERFEDRLQLLAARNFPSDAAPSLIKELLVEIDLQRKLVERLVLEFPKNPQGSFDRLQTEHLKLVLKLPYIKWLEDAQTDRVPWSLVPSIEVLVSALMPGRTLLTTSSHAFNYGIRWQPSGTGLRGFDILELPSMHRMNAFLHVLVGHELFHPIVHSFLVLERSSVYGRIKTECQKILLGGPHTHVAMDPHRLDKIVEAVADMWTDGLKELMCDMGCAALFGPAAAFALLYFAVTQGFDNVATDPPFYPAYRCRLRTILRYAFGEPAGKASYDKLLTTLRTHPDYPAPAAAARLEEEWKLLAVEAARDDDVRAVRADALLSVAYAEIDAALDRAWSYVASRIKSSPGITPWSDSTVEVPAHLRNLQMSVPSGEYRQFRAVSGPPGQLTAIALAAWLYQLQQEGTYKGQSTTEILSSYNRSCGILLKSFEDAELKKVYQQRKGKGGTP